MPSGSWPRGVSRQADRTAVASATALRAKLMAEHRGGTLRLVAKGAGGTLDPQINYTLQYWQLYQRDLRRPGRLQEGRRARGASRSCPTSPRRCPKPTNDGKTCTFKLRKGIKFSNGKALTVKDVRRLLPAHLQGLSARPPAPSTACIVGADKCLKTPATCTLEGRRGRRRSADTVTVQPHAAGRRVPRQARRAARRRSCRRTPTKDIGHQADARHRRLHVLGVRPEQGARRWCATRTSRSGRADAQPDGYPDKIDVRLRPDRRPRSPRSRTARPTGCSTRRRPTASTRSAPSTWTRCTSTR